MKKVGSSVDFKIKPITVAENQPIMAIYIDEVSADALADVFSEVRTGFLITLVVMRTGF